MAKKDQEQRLIIVCSAPKKKGCAPFERILANGDKETYYVELNKPVDVTDRPWVYYAWLNSYWNDGRDLTPSQESRRKNILDGTGDGAEEIYIDK